MEGFLVKIRTNGKGKPEERYFILNLEAKEMNFYQQDTKGFDHLNAFRHHYL